MGVCASRVEIEWKLTINPPYRAEVVGTFLRPQAVVEARAAFQKGVITRDDLTAVDDPNLNII